MLVLNIIISYNNNWNGFCVGHVYYYVGHCEVILIDNLLTEFYVFFICYTASHEVGFELTLTPAVTNFHFVFLSCAVVSHRF